MLATRQQTLAGKTCLVSGSGNVAQYTVEKLLDLGAKPVTLSDSSGYIYDEAGIDREKLKFAMDLKNVRRGRIKEYADKFKGVDVRPGGSQARLQPALEPQGRLRLPERDPERDQRQGRGEPAQERRLRAWPRARTCPARIDAVNQFLDAKILYGPGKAANAGGVATSGLEMSQNSMRLGWSREEVDAKLHGIMKSIHKACFETAERFGTPGNYVNGANIAGFLKVANAMMDQGVDLARSIDVPAESRASGAERSGRSWSSGARRGARASLMRDPQRMSSPHGRRFFHEYQSVMRHRVMDVVLASSPYDAFILEEAGELSERMVGEFRNLDLHYAPGLTSVSSGEEALCGLAQEQSRVNLIVTTPHLPDMDAAELAIRARRSGLDVPVVLLAWDPHELSRFLAEADTSAIERAFLWQGDARILVGIVKSVEDWRNVAEDTREVGVQVILLVEDNVRYYSSFLPTIYTELLHHSQRVIAEGLNLSQKILRMRARPKILLCTTWEEAEAAFVAYGEELLGIISDVEFPRGGRNTRSRARSCAA